MNLCKLCVSIFYICSSFLIKKLQKRERTCRAYMKVLEQCFCPLCLLPSPPLFLCYCICPGPSSAACTLCTVLSCTPSSLCFLLFWVISLHTDTIVPKVLSKSKRSHLQLLRWLLYIDVSLCFLSPPSTPLYALTATVYFFIFHSVFPLLCVY